MADLKELVAKAMAGDPAADRDLLILAGDGDIAAQRAVRDGILEGVCDIGSYMRAEVFARMLAARGNDDDRHKHGALLFLIALEGRRLDVEDIAEAWAHEALTIFRQLADDGDGSALQALSAMGPQFPNVMAALERGCPVPDGPPPGMPPEFYRAAMALIAGQMAAERGEAPPPVITLNAPFRMPWRSRLQLAVDDVVWSIRFRWWALVDRVKGRI